MTQSRYRIVGSRNGRPRKEVVEARDDDGALQAAHALCKRRGMTLKRLFHLERRNVTREVTVPA